MDAVQAMRMVADTRKLSMVSTGKLSAVPWPARQQCHRSHHEDPVTGTVEPGQRKCTQPGPYKGRTHVLPLPHTTPAQARPLPILQDQSCGCIHCPASVVAAPGCTGCSGQPLRHRHTDRIGDTNGEQTLRAGHGNRRHSRGAVVLDRTPAEGRNLQIGEVPAGLGLQRRICCPARDHRGLTEPVSHPLILQAHAGPTAGSILVKTESLCPGQGTGSETRGGTEKGSPHGGNGPGASGTGRGQCPERGSTYPHTGGRAGPTRNPGPDSRRPHGSHSGSATSRYESSQTTGTGTLHGPVCAHATRAPDDQPSGEDPACRSTACEPSNCTCCADIPGEGRHGRQTAGLSVNTNCAAQGPQSRITEPQGTQPPPPQRTCAHATAAKSRLACWFLAATCECACAAKVGGPRRTACAKKYRFLLCLLCLLCVSTWAQAHCSVAPPVAAALVPPPPPGLVPSPRELEQKRPDCDPPSFAWLVPPRHLVSFRHPSPDRQTLHANTVLSFIASKVLAHAAQCLCSSDHSSVLTVDRHLGLQVFQFSSLARQHQQGVQSWLEQCWPTHKAGSHEHLRESSGTCTPKTGLPSPACTQPYDAPALFKMYGMFSSTVSEAMFGASRLAGGLRLMRTVQDGSLDLQRGDPHTHGPLPSDLYDLSRGRALPFDLYDMSRALPFDLYDVSKYKALPFDLYDQGRCMALPFHRCSVHPHASSSSSSSRNSGSNTSSPLMRTSTLHSSSSRHSSNSSKRPAERRPRPLRDSFGAILALTPELCCSSSSSKQCESMIMSFDISSGSISSNSSGQLRRRTRAPLLLHKQLKHHQYVHDLPRLEHLRRHLHLLSSHALSSNPVFHTLMPALVQAQAMRAAIHLPLCRLHARIIAEASSVSQRQQILWQSILGSLSLHLPLTVHPQQQHQQQQLASRPQCHPRHDLVMPYVLMNSPPNTRVTASVARCKAKPLTTLQAPLVPVTGVADACPYPFTCRQRGRLRHPPQCRLLGPLLSPRRLWQGPVSRVHRALSLRPSQVLNKPSLMLHHAWQSSCSSTCRHAPRPGAGHQRGSRGWTVTTASHATYLCISHSHVYIPKEDGPVVTKAWRWLRLLSRHRSLFYQHVSHYGTLSPDSVTCMTHPPSSLTHVIWPVCNEDSGRIATVALPPLHLLPAC